MNKLFILLLFLTSTNSMASDYLLKTSLALTAVDYLQTREIKNNDIFYETNPALGEDPSDSKINSYFAISAISLILIDKYAPKKFSKVFNYGYIFMQSVYISSNYSIGVRIKL